MIAVVETEDPNLVDSVESAGNSVVALLVEVCSVAIEVSSEDRAVVSGELSVIMVGFDKFSSRVVVFQLVEFNVVATELICCEVVTSFSEVFVDCGSVVL